LSTVSDDSQGAQLHTIDLSLLNHPDPNVVDQLVELTRTAIKDDGFLYLDNYGMTPFVTGMPAYSEVQKAYP